MFIDDGTGKGYKVKVTREHMIYSLAVSQTIEHHANITHSGSYSVIFSQTPTGAGDFILYFKNLSNRDIVIEGIWLRASATEGINIHLRPAGTPTNGSEVTPVNLNASSANTAEATVIVDNDITGITNGHTALRYYVDNSARSVWFNFNQDIILTENDTLAISCVTGGIQIDGMLEFFFDYTNGASLG